MPGKSERHGRSKWEWGTPPARGQQVADAAQADAAASDVAPLPGRTRGRKDKDWCKPGPGHTHHPQLVMVRTWGRQGCGWRTSRRWVPDNPPKPLPRGVPVPRNYYRSWRKPGHWEETSRSWWCGHERHCTWCGKHLGWVGPEECPARGEADRDP